MKAFRPRYDGMVRKKSRHHGIRSSIVLAGTVFAVVAAFAIINACTPKESKQAQKSPYGTPEYIVELPPGYEDLRVLPGEEPSGGTQQGTGAAPEAARRSADTSSPQGAVPSVKTPEVALARPPAGESIPPRVSEHPNLIFVIDDVGYNKEELDPFLALPFPITFAIMPRLPHSSDSALAIRDAGKEMILHQPMEALGGNNPGPGAVYLSMDAATIEKTVAENIDSLPYPPVGMNNHMGSAVTRDRAAMTPILKLVKDRGMYYLDSLTAPGTVSAEICRETGTKCMERNVFLDNKSDRESILAAIDEGKRIARKNSAAVMIGHVWSANLAATLMEIYPELVEEGYSLSTISQYMLMQAEESRGDANPGN